MPLSTLKARLASLKAKGLSRAGQNWRDVRVAQLRESSAIYNPPFSAHGENNLRWVENVDKAGLRLKGYVRESRHAHGDYFASKPSLGWFTDNFQDEALYPVVYQLPARNGKPRFVYGYADPNNEGAALLSFDACDDENDAQRWACSMTKAFAEDAREEDAKFQAEQQTESLRETITELRKEFLELCAEARKACRAMPEMFPSIRKTVEGRLRAIVAERTKAFERIETLTDDYWQAVND